MEYLLVTSMIVGVTELVKRLFDSDYRGAVIILSAAIVGGISGFFGVEGLNVVTGVVTGLAAAGAVTVAQKV